MKTAQIIAYLVDVKRMSKAAAEAHLVGLSDEDNDKLKGDIKKWAESDDDEDELSGDKDDDELSEEEKEEKKRLALEDKEKSEKEENDKKEKKEAKLSRLADHTVINVGGLKVYVYSIEDDSFDVSIVDGDEEFEDGKSYKTKEAAANAGKEAAKSGRYKKWASLSAGKDEKEKQTKLTAVKADITKLSTDFRATTDNARLAATKGRIITRLSKLRAQAKITPAEVRKIDLVKLSASSPEAIDAVLLSYESREPVIHLGQFGTTKAENVSEHQAKTRMSRLEAETRANMPMLARSDKGKRLAEDEGAPRGMPRIDSTPPVPDPTPDTSSYEADYGHICQMIDQGNAIGAKDFLKKLLEKIALGGQSDDFAEANTLETENQLSALAESVQKMQTQFDTLSKLASSLVG